jgi:hypothetical protein
MLFTCTNQIVNPEDLFAITRKSSQEIWIEVEQKKDQAFKSMLQVSGYSGKTAHAIWNWYSSPEKGKTMEKEISHDRKEFEKQKTNNPADNTLVRTRKH